jgi:hypothetical protein
MRMQAVRNERGVALFLALLLLVVVASLAVGAIMLSGNATLLGKFHAKEAEMRASADAGLEWARDTINGTPGILPVPPANRTLQNAQPVRDATGAVIPGYSRSVFVGRSGSTTRQFGVFASVISRIDDNAGRAVVVRRSELSQQSFAQFARFDDITDPGVVFARGIQIFGPIHTNGILQVGNTPPTAIFWGPATTAATINTVANGDWRKGWTQGVPRINMPTATDLAALSAYATTANLVVAGGALGAGVFNPQTRIEFVAVDVNADGDYTDENEGFIRVYRAAGAAAANLNFTTARRWGGAAADATDPNSGGPNCGDQPAGPGQLFVPAVSHLLGLPAGHAHAGPTAAANRLASLNAAGRRCYLGGDPRLTNGWVVTAPAPFNYGSWVKWPGYGAGNAPAAIQNKASHTVNGGFNTGAAGPGGMADYLWPLNRVFNPTYTGVIYVNGSVAVSGIVRAQVTVAATGNIMLADDLTYVTSPGSVPDCDRNGAVFADILGLLTAQNFVIEDNNVNSPFRAGATGGAFAGYLNQFDDSGDETVHAASLTLTSVLAENLVDGPTNRETCAGSTVGRGCFNMVGAAIQGTNAGRMSAGGEGWNPQWTYDRCDMIKPPPYFPTTGRYFKNRYYEIDPVGFGVAAWFAANP